MEIELNKIGIIYQGLKKEGRRGALSEVARRTGHSRQYVSSVLTQKYVNNEIVAVAAQVLAEICQKEAEHKAVIAESLTIIKGDEPTI